MELPDYFRRYLQAVQPTRSSRERAIQVQTTLRDRLKNDTARRGGLCRESWPRGWDSRGPGSCTDADGDATVQWKRAGYRGSHRLTCELHREGMVLAWAEHVVNVKD